MRLLVCGGREYENYARVRTEIDIIHPDVVIHGASRGADTLANRAALELGIPVLRFPADWTREGRIAGMVRNRRMLELGKPDMVLSFPGGRGTANMVALAKASKIPVYKVK